MTERRIALNDRIVVIEDDESMRKLIMTVLREAGLNAYREYGNGLDAKEGIIKDVPDLAIMDLNIPLLHGYELLKWMKSERLYKDIAVIVISGAELKTGRDRGRALSNGAIYTLPKPFDIEDLLSQVRKAFELRKQILSDGRSGHPSTIDQRIRVERIFRLSQNLVPFAAGAADLQSFGAIADERFDQGTGLIVETANLIEGIVKSFPDGSPDPLGWYGKAGDDMFYFFSPSRIPEVPDRIAREFDLLVESRDFESGNPSSGIYTPKERARGWVFGKNDSVAPIVSIPQGIATNIRRNGQVFAYPTPHSIYATPRETLNRQKAVLRKGANLSYKRYVTSRAKRTPWSTWELAHKVYLDTTHRDGMSEDQSGSKGKGIEAAN